MPYGVVDAVDVTDLTTGVYEPVPEGTGLLEVDDPALFDPDGGKLVAVEQESSEDGSGEDIRTELLYTSVDDEGFLVLAEPLAVGLSEFVILSPIPGSVEMVATVLPDSGDDPLDCRVHHALGFSASMAEGEREESPLLRARVRYEFVDGQPMVMDIVAKPSEVDAEAVPPGGSDGDAPAESPAPSTLAGLRQVFIKWDGVPNADLVRYEVHISTGAIEGLPAAVAGDPATLAVTTGATLVSLSALADGTPLQYDATYAIAVIATDVDGAAPASAWVPGVIDRTASGDIVAGAVTADKLEAVMALVSTIMVGALIEISPPTNENGVLGGGIVVRNPDEPDGEPLIRLHPDGSTFRGRVETDILTVLQDFIINGKGAISSGGSMTLGFGVADPTAGPVWNSAPLREGWPGMPDGFIQRGICGPGGGSGDSAFFRLLVPTSGEADGRSVVHSIDAAGKQTGRVTLADTPYDLNDFNGIVKVGDFFYSMGKVRGKPDWALVKWRRSDGSFVSLGVSIADVIGRPTVGPVAESETLVGEPDLMIAAMAKSTQGVDRFYLHLLDTSVGIDREDRTSNGGWDAEEYFPYKGYLRGCCAGGKGEYGVETRQGGSVFLIANDAKIVVFNSGADQALSPEPSLSFNLHADAVKGGFCWDGQKFTSTHGMAERFTYGSQRDNSSSYWGRFADRGGSKTTKASPATSHLPPNRWFPTVTVRQAPSGVDGFDVWTGYGTGEPDTYYKRSEAKKGRSMTLTKLKDTSGSTALPAENTFGEGAPAFITSDIGGFIVRGDGSGSWPLLDELRVGAWTDPTFENSWKSRTDFEPVRYRTVGKNRVELTGYADAGTANAVMFTLPSGFRPKFHKSFPVICQTRNTGAASTGTAHTHPMADIGLRLMVAADGTVRTANAASGWVCLSGVLINLD